MAPREKGPRRLGLVAFFVAIGAIVIGGVLQFIAGAQLGGIAQYVDITAAVQSGTALDLSTFPEPAKVIVANVSALTTTGLVAWGALSLWALIQGIVAIVRRRGRAWGVAAIVAVALGYVIVQTAYAAGLSIGAAPYL